MRYVVKQTDYRYLHILEEPYPKTAMDLKQLLDTGIEGIDYSWGELDLGDSDLSVPETVMIIDRDLFVGYLPVKQPSEKREKRYYTEYSGQTELCEMYTAVVCFDHEHKVVCSVDILDTRDEAVKFVAHTIGMRYPGSDKDEITRILNNKGRFRVDDESDYEWHIETVHWSCEYLWNGCKGGWRRDCPRLFPVHRTCAIHQKP